MYDTPPEVDERDRVMLMQRTEVERLIMGCAMRDTARAFVEASLRERDSYATVADIRKGRFFRFYGRECDVLTRDKILPAIERGASQRNNDS